MKDLTPFWQRKAFHLGMMVFSIASLLFWCWLIWLYYANNTPVKQRLWLVTFIFLSLSSGWQFYNRYKKASALERSKAGIK